MAISTAPPVDPEDRVLLPITAEESVSSAQINECNRSRGVNHSSSGDLRPPPPFIDCVEDVDDRCVDVVDGLREYCKGKVLDFVQAAAGADRVVQNDADGFKRPFPVVPRCFCEDTGFVIVTAGNILVSWCEVRRTKCNGNRGIGRTMAGLLGIDKLRKRRC